MIVYLVVFRDLTQLELPEGKGEVIKAAWLAGRKSPFEYEGNGYHTGDIIRVIKKQKRDEEKENLLPPPATLLPEEERQHKLEMVQKLREDFARKRKAKREG